MKPLRCLAALLLSLAVALPALTEDKHEGRRRLRADVQRQGPDRLGQRQLRPVHLLREGQRDHHHRQADRLPAHRRSSTRTSSPSSTGCTCRPSPARSATAASSSGPIRSRPSAPATRAASRCRCSSTSLQEQEGRDHGHQPGRPVQHLGRDLRARPAAPRRLGALPAVGEPRQGRERVEPLPRRGQRRRHQAGRQRQGRLRRQQVQAAQGLSRPGVGRLGVPLQEPEDQGTAQHQPEAGRDRRRGAGASSTCTPASTCRAGRRTTRRRSTGSRRTRCCTTTARARRCGRRRSIGDAEFVVDFRFPAKDGKPCEFVLRDAQDGGYVKLTIGPDGKVDIELTVTRPAD